MWEDAYLTQRSSIAINTNPFFTLEDDPTPARTSQIARATTLVWSSLLFCQSVRTGKVEPDVQRTTPLCMCQYPKLFGTTRIPLPKRDRTVFCNDSKHMVVMSKGQVYWFDVFDANMEMSLTRETLAETLREIREDSGTMEPEDRMHSAVGVLTSDEREVWARWRKHLEGNVGNAESLSIIDTSLFVLCLDDTTPPSPSDMAKVALHGTSVVDLSYGSAGVQRGTCINRWYDKSLQIIVCQNGAAGVNFEHSVIDGHTVLRFASDVFTETILRFAETIRSNFARRQTAGAQSCGSGEQSTVAPVAYSRIHWVLDPDLVAAMLIAESKLSDRIPQVDMQVLEFAAFGKNWVVENKLSPDAFVQIAFQVAYYRVYRACVCTYETIMTKKFFHGRTEAGFVVTHASKALCEGFNAANSVETLQSLLKAALDAHVAVVRLASQGRGIRTLYAMKCVAQKQQQTAAGAGPDSLPELYSSEGWRQLSTNLLSTSNCGNPALRMFGFGPVSPMCFGIGYIIKDDNMQFCVSTYNRQTARFISSLEVWHVHARRTHTHKRQMPSLRSSDANPPSFPTLAFLPLACRGSVFDLYACGPTSHRWQDTLVTFRRILMNNMSSALRSESSLNAHTPTVPRMSPINRASSSLQSLSIDTSSNASLKPPFLSG